MHTTSRVALKEWAVVVRALNEGRQVALLRKGGIADPDGTFRLQEKEFFLYPTFEHQRAEQLKPSAHPELQKSRLARPAVPTVVLDTYAVVHDARPVSGEAELAPLLETSIWNEAYVRQRLAYKPEKPLLLVTLRAHRLARPIAIEETAEQAGCVSWVPLSQSYPTSPSTPSLNDADFKNLADRLRSPDARPRTR